MNTKLLDIEMLARRERERDTLYVMLYVILWY
jgi:hypothetical protein